MPFSTSFFKEQTLNFIKNKFDPDIQILDIGAGSGTYADLLKPHFQNIDAVEVFAPYVAEYNLKEKYNNVIVDDICTTDIDLSKYSLFILGDVLEHIEESAAIILLDKLLAENADIIICVPFNAHQDEHFGNIHERHLQPTLTLTRFLTLHPQFIPLCIRYDYGIFIKKTRTTETTPLFYVDIDDDLIENLHTAYPYRAIKNINEIQPTVNILDVLKETDMNKEITIVTGLWNLGRDNISDSFKRSYNYYKEKFAELLKSPVNMVIYVSKEDESFVWSHRSRKNTTVKIIELSEFDSWFEHFQLVQNIRKLDSWKSQASWLGDSPQAQLDYYNPIVMSKMFMLNNATLYNPFNSKYFFWIDAGITSTVHPGYFTHDKVFNNLPEYMDEVQKFLFLSYPYDGGEEIHGFERREIARYCNTEYVNYVCRGGFFGGEKSIINNMNGIYHSILTDTLQKNLMGTEESLFTILAHNHKELVSTFPLSTDGLVWPFFEKLKNVQSMIDELPPKEISYETTKINLYILGFNSPAQFKVMCDTLNAADVEFLTKCKKILINNSTDESLFSEYDSLCELHGFEEIHRENLGVCGGRQFIAEHFDADGADFYFFLEDDMLFNNSLDTGYCKEGFKKFVPNLCKNSVSIMLKEKFDFLKLSFSEFFGNNGQQWAWYNVPQSIRTEYWPHYDKLPEHGLDPNSPKTIFNTIQSFENTSYITGDIYYSNWPQIVCREGNKKMFLDTTWAHPFEQTWMSHMFQLTKKDKLKGSVLLASPITHNRFEHYQPGLRKES